jgi:prepilin-type processing-associated H-X9-DG protein
MCATVRRGMTRIELLVGAVCFLTIGAIVVVAFGQTTRPAVVESAAFAHPKSMQDRNQVRNVYLAMLNFAADNKGLLPEPGLINRSTDPTLGNQPGIGPRDITLNTTANLFSAMIAQNYFEPAAVISPVERNAKVSVDSDYNHDAYQPGADVYWDSKFKADLAVESNVSYAHMPIFGQRAKLYWRDAKLPKLALLGNRGPKDGATDPSSFTCSPHGHWEGNVVFSDGHAQFFKSTTVAWDGAERTDNFFLQEGGDANDSFLTFTKEMAEGGPVIQHD